MKAKTNNLTQEEKDIIREALNCHDCLNQMPRVTEEQKETIIQKLKGEFK